MKSSCISKEHPDIGKIKYLLNRNIKGFRIKVQSFKETTISIPKGASIKEADQFLLQKKDWILKNISKIRDHEIQVLKKQKEIPEIDMVQAKEMLNERIRSLAVANNFQYKKIFVKRQRTRWGSCSTKGNINLNVNLAHLPVDLMDYVMLHELVHTRINGHGKVFWNELDKYVVNSKLKNKELKLYNYLLYRQ